MELSVGLVKQWVNRENGLKKSDSVYVVRAYDYGFCRYSHGIELTNKSLSQALPQVKHGTDFVRIWSF